jgi:hypothetical protein
LEAWLAGGLLEDVARAHGSSLLSAESAAIAGELRDYYAGMGMMPVDIDINALIESSELEWEDLIGTPIGEEYWTTEPGLTRRAGFVGQMLLSRVSVASAVAHARENGTRLKWRTAGDDRVCKLCLLLEGAEFGADDAFDLPPLHPDCRCWLELII